METYEWECCIRGYHVYKDTWEAAIGEELEYVREQSNAVDRYAVAVLKDDTIIGHLPKTLVCIYSFFLRSGVIYTMSCCRKEKVFRFTSKYKNFA